MSYKNFTLSIGEIAADMQPIASEKPGVTYKVTLNCPSGKYTTTSLEGEHIARGIQALLTEATLAHCVHLCGSGRPQEVVGWELTIGHERQLSQAEKAFVLGSLLQNCALKKIPERIPASAGTAI